MTKRSAVLVASVPRRGGGYGAVVPDVAESTDHPPHPRPVDAVLFDFHGTLAQVEDPVTWVIAAAAACGRGPLPHRVPPHLAEHWADRDLYEHSHRAAYTGLAATVNTDVEGLADALYDRLLGPDGWLPYPDTGPTLRTLHSAGIKVAVVSNIGFDIRPHFAAWGLDALVDAFVLSYEVGRCKPDPAIFRSACDMVGVEPERTLMVGDTPADAGAVRAGCAALVLPAAEPGRANGLGATLALAGCRA
jgi:HAD superfamily hydrolase (TIGR01509 family)